MTQIFSNRRLFSLIILLIVSNLIITGVSILIIYKKAISAIEVTLIDNVERKKSIVTVLKDQGKNESEIIQFIKAMRDKRQNIGRSGEFVIAYQSGDSINFLLNLGTGSPININHAKGHAVPMRMALAGKSGFIKAKDYKGINVFAAYTYVPEFRWGIVAKIPTSEVNQPYYNAIIIAFLFSVLFISFCIILFVKISKPLLQTFIESEAHYRSLFKSNQACMLLINPLNGNIADVSKGACLYYGYDYNTMVSMNISGINALPPEQVKKQQNKVQLFFKHKLANGALRDVEVLTGSIILKKETFLYSVIIDITERKLAEEAMRLSEERLRLVSDSSNDFIYSYDLQGRFTSVNRTFEKFIRISADKVIGKTNRELGFHEPRSRQLAELHKQVLGSNNTVSGETSIQMPDSTIRHFEITLNPLHNLKGKIIGVGGTSHDITLRKETELLLEDRNCEIEAQNEELSQINDELIFAKEKAVESDRFKTAFLQNMSHEIRTPMTAIIGFSEFLVQNYNNKSNLEKFSEIINRRCHDLLKIINDILDIAKIESGKLPVNIEKCNINAVFDELRLFFTEHQKKLNKQHIAFNLKTTCDPSYLNIEIDDVKLKQIFINLLSNAFKFTDSGTIEGGCMMDTHNNLLFYVSDTGFGIPPEKQKFVFERFMQLNQKPNRLFGGTGLGLSIVKGLVDLLDGKIWMESELNKGTTFYFTLSYKLVDAKDMKTKKVKSVKDFIYTNTTVLIVEDDVNNAEYLKLILTAVGLTTMHSFTGKEAITMSTSQNIDIVLMDINLPDMTGFEAIKEIKQYKPDLKIIAQTAYASTEDQQKVIEAGCVDYISKPYNRNLLLSMIGKHLMNHN